MNPTDRRRRYQPGRRQPRSVADYAALARARATSPRPPKLWTNAAEAAQFAANLEDYPKVAITAGKPTDEEGAAGSIFITVPVTLDLTLRSGSPYQMTCKATLRRVNDVPGATAKQRRWHIRRSTADDYFRNFLITSDRPWSSAATGVIDRAIGGRRRVPRPGDIEANQIIPPPTTGPSSGF